MRRLDAAFWRRSFGPAYGLLLVSFLVFGSLASWPFVLSAVLAVAGATLASLVRGLLPASSGFLGLLPALGVLAILAVETPVGVVPAVVAGATGLALLFWCAEEPGRAPGALRRGLGALAIPALGFALALLSADLLPSGLGTVGVAVALLLFSLAAVVLLLASPRSFDRDPSASS